MKNNLNFTLEWEKVKEANHAGKTDIFVLASFTANPLEPYLGMDCHKDGMYTNIEIGPYNQIISQCMNEDSELYGKNPDYLIIWPRLEDIIGTVDFFRQESLSLCKNNISVLADAVLYAAKKLKAKIVFMLPSLYDLRPIGVGDIQAQNGVINTSLEIRKWLLEKLRSKDKILLGDCEDIMRQIGVEHAYNMTMYTLAKIPYTECYFQEIAASISQIIKLDKDNSRNLLVMDANILLCEKLEEFKNLEPIEIENLVIDDHYLMFQKYLKEIKKWGNDIILCTKSSDDVLHSILSREDVLVEYKDFKHVSCNNNSIMDAIQGISQKNAIPLKRFVVFDTRALKLEEVNQVVLPEDPSLWITAVDKSHYLDHLPLEDQFRSDNTHLTEADEGIDINQFLQNLDLSVAVQKIDDQQIEKIHHITHSTKDFNFTGLEYGQEEIREMMTSQEHYIYGVRVKDRFGDYGIAGAVLVTIKGTSMEIENLLLNCRVLGKNVEFMVFEQLVKYAKEFDCNEISIRFCSNSRNDAAAAFISKLIDENLDGIKSGKTFEIQNAAIEKNVRRVLDQKKKNGNRESTVKCHENGSTYNLINGIWNKKSIGKRNRIISSIANINSIDKIMLEIKSASQKARPDTNVAYIAPRTETEQKLVELWSEILNLEKVGVLDNFFGIGGTSILAAQLIIKFKQAFGVELPVRIFFDNSTIEQMAMYIAALQMEENNENLRNTAVSNFRYKTREFLKNEVWLDKEITAKGAKKEKAISDMKKVLLTGGTGFLGAFLLSDLLEKTDFTISALVRADSVENGSIKLKNNMEKYYLWKESYKERINIVIGDLSKLLLGLDVNAFNQLAQEIDMIYHCGAITNFLEPYRMIKDTNVQGTQEILRLASLYQLKPVHYVSTHYVFSNLTHENGHVVYEDDIPTNNEILVIGYQQTKWVGEQLMNIARERGIPTSIYRPGRISGSSKTGACQTQDIMWLMIKCCVEAGLLFEEPISIEFIPVDYISETIVSLSIQDQSKNKNFHLISKIMNTLEQVYDWMCDDGFDVKRYSYAGWKQELVESVVRNPGLHTTKSMLPFIPDDMSEWDVELVFDTRNTEEGLKGTGITCPEVDKDVFKRYIDYFVETGYFIKYQK